MRYAGPSVLKLQFVFAMLSFASAASVPGLSSPLLAGNPGALAWLQQYSRLQFEGGTGSGPDLQVRSAAAAAALASACPPANTNAGALARRSVVVAAVGDAWDAGAWLDRPDAATFSVVAIYYGRNPSYRCERCAATVHRRGPKFRLVADLLLGDEALFASIAPPGGFDYIMFADDDLTGMDTCAFNKVFALVRVLDLLIAQPAVCRDGERSYTFHDVCYAHRGYVARFSNFVEIMAPVVRWDLWSEVLRWTLDQSWTGMGLDWGWPYFLGFPRDRFAILDAVCMVHPPSPPDKPNSVYAAEAPYGAEEEKHRVYAGLGYSRLAARWLGERRERARWYCGIPVPAEQLPAGVPPQPACNPLVSQEPAWTIALLPAWAIPPSAVLLLLLLCAGVAVAGQAAVARLALAFQPRGKAHV